jgi:hypothetical protein
MGHNDMKGFTHKKGIKILIWVLRSKKLRVEGCQKWHDMPFLHWSSCWCPFNWHANFCFNPTHKLTLL